MFDIPGIDIPGPGDILGGIGGFFGGLAADAGQAIIELVLTVIFGFIADAVAAIIGALAPAFNSTTLQVSLQSGWFVGEGAEVTTITSLVAGSLVLVFLFMSLIRSLFAGEFSGMWRAALIDVPIAFMATALTVTVAAGLLAAVDEASVSLLGSDGEALVAFSDSLADAERIGAAGLLGILFGILFIIGAVLIWIQLLVRSALIYMVIAFAPITWVTRAYPGTRHIAKRGAEIGVALIVSKFAMAVSFRLGSAAMSASNADTGDEVNLSAMLIGASIMLMTAFMPWMVFKAVPFAEAATVGAGAERAAVGTAVVAGGLALAGISKLAGTGGGGSSGGGGTKQAGDTADLGSDATSAEGGGGGGGTGSSGGSGSGSGGGGSGGGASGGGGGAASGGAAVAAVAAEKTSDASLGAANGAVEATKAAVGTSSAGGRSGSSSSGGGSTGATSGGGGSGSGGGGSSGGGGGFPSTPVGGSPGIGVVEVEVETEAPTPASAGVANGSGAQPLSSVRRKATK